mmetsp:Transcript_21429/g.27713  ORF Transcript_21429/g.27713 Transcript_21429/m.27713 type:complete len:205 (-) Transcript_21429:979-1593(-)
MSNEDEPALSDWSKKEEENRADGNRAEYEAETNPKRRCFHANVLTVSLVAGSCLFLMLVGQLVGIIFQDLGPVSLVIRTYLVVLSFLGILVELEWTSIAKSAVLHNWISRGLFYAFIGVLGLQENDSASLRDENRVGDKIALNYVKVVAQMMIGLGCLYFFMGITCMQIWYNRQVEDYKSRVERGRTVRQTAQRYGVEPDVDIV